MVLAPRLELRQGQSLVMTPQLQQAIKLLQLSSLDLVDYVEQEIERNPLLQQETGEGVTTPTETQAEGAGGEPDAGGDFDDSPGIAELSLNEDSAPPSTASDLDTDFENIYADESAADVAAGAAAEAAAETGSDTMASGDEVDAAETPGPTGSDWQSARTGGAGSGDGNGIELTVAREKTLTEHLTEQLHMAITDPQQRLIGAFLIDQTDEAGYLMEDVPALAERIGAAITDVEAVLDVVHTFDPVGICARNLKECLALQLADKDRLDPIMAKFLDHLDLFAKRDIDQLIKLLGIDGEDIQSMVEDIRRCNPKPGLVFGSELIQAVVPDVFVREKRDGGWMVELNSETLPRVLVNSQYYAEVSQCAKDPATKAFLSECMNNANWLVKSLDQRARTILKVASEIVRQQDAFLVHGVRHLKPLNLKTIADAISMHESTVSRVTANKFIATPRGIFEMKYFFTSSIASSEGGDAYSAEAVRDRIRELINNEKPDAVLSDDTIVELLRGSGIEIARRTVAKYLISTTAA